ncbi:MAG: PilZ domain-containing protein [Desulfobacterales bacterium]|nr:MAG: PilZ domain-containing protein [Desulfobacterales bacterium]
MRRFTKNITLYDFAPALVKEWHPSSNGPLTPRNVKIAYPKKVWWICGQSHEWQATIKSRLNGGKCQLCVQVGQNVNLRDHSESLSGNEKYAKGRATLQSPLTAFELDAPDDNVGHNFRKSRRFLIRTTVVLENPNSGHWFYADAKNFSAGGMCFESEVPVTPGTRLIIKLDRPLFNSDRKNFTSIIRWCRTLDQEDKTFSGYAIGAIFI